MIHPPHALLTVLTHYLDEIARVWVRSQADARPPKVTEEELETQARLILDEMTRLLTTPSSLSRADSELVALLTALSQQRARQGFTPAQTMRFLLDLRTALLPFLLNPTPSDPSEPLESLTTLSTLVNELTLALFEIHLQGRVGVLPTLTDSPDDAPLMEPWPRLLVLPVRDGWASLPEQAAGLLESAVVHRARAVLLDFTTVQEIGLEEAQQWVQTSRALRLLGVTPLLMGLSPLVAHVLALAGLEPG